MWGAIPGLLASPVFRYAAVGLAIFAFISYQRNDAASEARLEAEEVCRQEVQARTEAEVERQMEAIETVLEAERRRADQAEREIEELRGRADELLDDVRASGSTCPLDADTLRRLRDIR